MPQSLRITVKYWNPHRDGGVLDEWTEYMPYPRSGTADALFTRCESNMRRAGYDTRGGAYQVFDGDVLSAMIADR